MKTALLAWICGILVWAGGLPAATNSPGGAGSGANRKSPMLIDVRTPAEFKEKHLKGAINIPVDEVEQRIAKVAADKKTPLLVHCRSGRRSATAKATLEKLGYTNVKDLGSYEDARKAVEGSAGK